MKTAGSDTAGGESTMRGDEMMAPTLRLSRHSLASLILFISGSALTGIAYGLPDPMIVSAIMFVLCLGIIWSLAVTGPLERRALMISFCVCWFWAGVSSIYAEYFNDPSQNSLDAAYFLEMVTKGDAADLGVLELLFLQENGGAMLLWRSIYDAFSLLGFEKVRYVGVAANVAMVSLSAVVGVRMVKTIFGHDSARICRFILLFSSCGLFWMFAAIHLRDAAVLLAVSILTQYWVGFLASPRGATLCKLLIASVIAFVAFGMLRSEFVFVPIAMLAAGLMAIFMGSSDRKERKRILLWAIVVGIPLGTWLIIQVQSDLAQAFFRGRQTYNDLTAAESGQGSLGNSLIMNQPAPIRLVLGFVYLLVFPVPFWSGFLEHTAYHLFKSFHALYMYALLPLVYLSAIRVFRNRASIGTPVLFLLFVAGGFAISISYTSLENRHFGTFLVSLLVLATVTDLRNSVERAAYRALLGKFLCMVLLVHLAWGSLKAVS